MPHIKRHLHVQLKQLTSITFICGLEVFQMQTFSKSKDKANSFDNRFRPQRLGKDRFK